MCYNQLQERGFLPSRLTENANQSGADRCCEKLKPDIRGKVKALFEQFHREIDAVNEDVEKEYIKKLVSYQQLGNLTKILGMMDWTDSEKNYRNRNLLGGGIQALEDIYCALSGGRSRSAKETVYGHSEQYFSDIKNRASEILADYGDLSAARPDLITMLKQDKPDLVDALQEAVKEMLRKVGA